MINSRLIGMIVGGLVMLISWIGLKFGFTIEGFLRGSLVIAILFTIVFLMVVAFENRTPRR